MNNLFVETRLNLDLATEVAAYCVDSDNKQLFVLTTDQRILKFDTRVPSKEPLLVAEEFKLPETEVKLFEYIVESGSLLLATREGHVIRIGISSFSPPSKQIYKHLIPICSLVATRDQDLIAIADIKNDIHIMNPDFSSIYYTANSLTDNDSLHKPVGVGWGSKETQFFGLDGRPSKEKQNPKASKLGEHDAEQARFIESSSLYKATRHCYELETIIDWRGDSQFLASLTFIPENGKHYLKVWNRKLELQYLSEQLFDIERGFLAWVPNGKFITCAQRREQHINELAFFEKNGMVHERLTIPEMLKYTYIQNVLWSGDSSILALIVNQFSVSDKQVIFKPILLLYTVHNFHYYLKSSTYLEKNSSYKLGWDPIKTRRLRVVSNMGRYTEYDCNFGVTFSEDCSTIAVVDENKILVTPMSDCNIPPPMCAITVELDSLIHYLTLDTRNAASMVVSTLSGLVASFDHECQDKVHVPVKMTVHNKKAERLSRRYNFYKISENELHPSIHKHPCLSSPIGEKTIALNSESSLFLGDKPLVTNICTSFRVTENYLLYTTIDNNMHFILLSDLSTNSDHRTVDTWAQPIENGATLLVVSEPESKVVLQMPRGNLEILHPRVLVFAKVTTLLDTREYLQAFEIARKQRLNLNFLADYLLRVYGVDELNSFACQIASHDTNWLNVLISELSDEDTIIGRYESIMRRLPRRKLDLEKTPDFDITDKVNIVCSTIKLPDEPKFLQPKLLCLLNKRPKEIQQALREVHELNKDEKESALRFIMYFIDVDVLFNEALKTYDTDLALMVAGASNKDPKRYLALLDNFNSFQDEDKRRFEIDVHVSDYARALVHLLFLIAKSNDKVTLRNQFFDIVCSKRLYRTAMITLSQPEIHELDLKERVWENYASYLLEKRYFTEAGLAYSKALAIRPRDEYLSSAIKCFSLNREDDLLAMVALKKVPDEISRRHLDSLKKRLMQNGYGAEAIAISNLYNHDVAIEDLRSLISEENWYLAEALANNESRSLVRAEIAEALTGKVKRDLDEKTKELSTAQAHFDRLKILLTTRADQMTDASRENFISDSLSTVDGSETSSKSSHQGGGLGVARSGASSIKTRVSSKSSKSKGKKRITLKTGSRYEDLAIALELQRFVTDMRREYDRFNRLNIALYEYLDFVTASDYSYQIDDLLASWSNLASIVVDLLWPGKLMAEHRYSLFARFGPTLEFDDDGITQLMVLVRPETPRELNLSFRVL